MELLGPSFWWFLGSFWGVGFLGFGFLGIFKVFFGFGNDRFVSYRYFTNSSASLVPIHRLSARVMSSNL